MARPSSFTKELGTEICARLIGGESLRAICRDEGMPDKTTVGRWLAHDELYDEFRTQYAQARAIQAEMMADEILDIADDGSNDWMEKLDKDGSCIGYQLNGEHVQRSKLRVDSRKWVAAKLLPKKYGDSVTQKHVGPNDGPVQISDMSDREIGRRIAFALSKAANGPDAG